MWLGVETLGRNTGGGERAATLAVVHVNTVWQPGGSMCGIESWRGASGVG